jgi:hypothetical protein
VQKTKINDADRLRKYLGVERSQIFQVFADADITDGQLKLVGDTYDDPTLGCMVVGGLFGSDQANLLVNEPFKK